LWRATLPAIFTFTYGDAFHHFLGDWHFAFYAAVPCLERWRCGLDMTAERRAAFVVR